MYSRGKGLYHRSCAALSLLVNVSTEIKKYRPYLVLTIYIDSTHKKKYKPAFDGTLKHKRFLQCGICERSRCSVSAATLNGIRHALHKHHPWQRCTSTRRRQGEELGKHQQQSAERQLTLMQDVCQPIEQDHFGPFCLLQIESIMFKSSVSRPKHCISLCVFITWVSVVPEVVSRWIYSSFPIIP